MAFSANLESCSYIFMQTKYIVIIMYDNYPLLDFLSHKIEKERLRAAESAGFHRKHITGCEVAEDTDKERKLLQLHTCEVIISIHNHSVSTTLCLLVVLLLLSTTLTFSI